MKITTVKWQVSTDQTWLQQWPNQKIKCTIPLEPRGIRRKTIRPKGSRKWKIKDHTGITYQEQRKVEIWYCHWFDINNENGWHNRTRQWGFNSFILNSSTKNLMVEKIAKSPWIIKSPGNSTSLTDGFRTPGAPFHRESPNMRARARMVASDRFRKYCLGRFFHHEGHCTRTILSYWPWFPFFNLCIITLFLYPCHSF